MTQHFITLDFAVREAAITRNYAAIAAALSQTSGYYNAVSSANTNYLYQFVLGMR